VAALFTRDEIRAALEEIARILDRRRVRARIFVVGGAAMALAYYDRAATKDVDALFAPADLVAKAADAVGQARGYPSGWLNDAVKVFMPVHGEQVHQPVLEVGSVSVSVAAPDLLLAMKLRAARGRRDLEDIAVLVGACGLTSVDEAKAIFEAFFPEHDLSVRALGALEAALETP
jgi:hypothetical protein